ncbi:hypothetical protein [Mycoplasmopsis columbinasalis]|uniref:Uncharacterized protein n=1 Tax=Mycoplasmopsis columbinasalis TaxID=114880 RepID=A0A449B9G4_9BACT|nr:hypothetical protein [Mycoplasmopsis columbinasalis]VEU77820.1 Uncharacterised protein [Mycoplasmopsis columbinasalis]
MGVLQKYFKVTYRINPEYDYSIDAGTHAHPNELHYVFSRLQKGASESKRQYVSNVIKNIGRPSDYVDDHSEGWNNTNQQATYQIGSLTFTQALTPLGKSTTAEDFIAGAKAIWSSIEPAYAKYNNQALLDYMRKYFRIDGKFEPSLYDIYFDFDTTHAHGLSNVHFYYKLIDKTTGQTTAKAFGINYWASEFRVGEYIFPKTAATSTHDDTSLASEPQKLLRDQALYTSRWDFINLLANAQDNKTDFINHLKDFFKLGSVENATSELVGIDKEQTLRANPFQLDWSTLTINKNESSADNQAGTLTLVFDLKNLYTGTVEKVTHTIYGFVTENMLTRNLVKNNFFTSVFDGELTLTPLVDLVSNQSKGLAQNILTNLRRLENFADQVAYLQADLGLGDLNFKPAADATYTFALDASKIVSDEHNPNLEVLELVVTRTQNQQTQQATIKIRGLNGAKSVSPTGKMSYLANQLQVDTYVQPTSYLNYEENTPTDISRARTKLLPTAVLTNLVSESVDETIDNFYDRDIASFENKFAYQQADFSNRHKLVLMLIEEDKQTKARTLRKVEIDNFGLYRQLGTMLLTTNAAQDNKENAAYLGITTTDDDHNLSFKLKTLPTENKAKMHEILHILELDNVLGFKIFTTNNSGEKQLQTTLFAADDTLLENARLVDAKAIKVRTKDLLSLTFALKTGTDNSEKLLPILISLKD